MRILSVAGARPNFMKVAPIVRALGRHPAGFQHVLVHTGQHYDEKMSDSFFRDLGIPAPDYNLEVGSGSHAQQTAAVMVKIEPVLTQVNPDLIIVVGDVNSTVAATLTAKKLNQRVAHVEAGLRSFDRTMPEEINRLCTDAIADLLFTTDRLAGEQLRKEGVAEDRIYFVGNVMIDTLMSHVEAARRAAFARTLGLTNGAYATLTLHRPSNVETREGLETILDAILEAVPGLPIIFPIHPRTRQRIESFGLADRFSDSPSQPGIFPVEPLGYIEFLSLNAGARIVMTDSGGLQEETSVLGVPCVTLRENTERPVTITEGTNHLAGVSREGILRATAAAMALQPGAGRCPEFWDGRAAERIVEVIAALGPQPATR